MAAEAHAALHITHKDIDLASASSPRHPEKHITAGGAGALPMNAIETTVYPRADPSASTPDAGSGCFLHEKWVDCP